MDMDYVKPADVAVAMLEAVGANVDVFAVSREKVVSHGFKTGRTVNFERVLSAKHPRTKDQVRITEGVIGMRVRQKQNVQPSGSQRRDASLVRRRTPCPDVARDEDVFVRQRRTVSSSAAVAGYGGVARLDFSPRSKKSVEGATCR